MDPNYSRHGIANDGRGKDDSGISSSIPYWQINLGQSTVLQASPERLGLCGGTQRSRACATECQNTTARKLGSRVPSPDFPAQVAVARGRMGVRDGRDTQKWGDWGAGTYCGRWEASAGNMLLS